jgi:hypothetical protein
MNTNMGLLPLLLSIMFVPDNTYFLWDFDSAKIVYCRSAGGNISNPLDWEPGEVHQCPGSEYICAISLFKEDIYTLAEASAAGNINWVNHPKVNKPDTQLVEDIAIAVKSNIDNQIIHGRKYFKRNTF